MLTNLDNIDGKLIKNNYHNALVYLQGIYTRFSPANIKVIITNFQKYGHILEKKYNVNVN